MQMKKTLAAAFFMAAMVVLPVTAQPPGNVSITFEFLFASDADFKDGIGIADPNDQNSPCTVRQFGARVSQPATGTWDLDQNMGTNLNGPAVGISNLVPPLAPVGGWLPASGGIDTNVACPIPGSPTVGDHSLWLVWSGMNWRTFDQESWATLRLCTQKTFSSSSPGCLALPDASLRLWATACAPGSDSFSAHYLDGKGKYLGGVPFDTLLFKNDALACTAAHSHDYTNTIQDFTAGGAAQTFKYVKNEAVVHAGSVAAQSLGTRSATYMTVCWQATYLNFSDPLNPTTNLAQTHDWKLIWDLTSIPVAGSPGVVTAVTEHYFGKLARDGSHAGGNTVAMRGFYSDDAGATGQNGFGSCTSGTLPEAKKPAPLI
jgi:hypothetical protein